MKNLKTSKRTMTKRMFEHVRRLKSRNNIPSPLGALGSEGRRGFSKP